MISKELRESLSAWAGCWQVAAVSRGSDAGHSKTDDSHGAGEVFVLFNFDKPRAVSRGLSSQPGKLTNQIS